ncbi:hypothetical protein TNCV_203661 [Trichonephila clavipes]|nr:hypothetical protein TNCV_203661 [Trichonephila clavipes]
MYYGLRLLKVSRSIFWSVISTDYLSPATRTKLNELADECSERIPRQSSTVPHCDWTAFDSNGNVETAHSLIEVRIKSGATRRNFWNFKKAD